MESADDGSAGVVGIDVEGAVVDVDGHGVISAVRGRGVEREPIESFDDFSYGLLEGGVTERTSQLPASPGAFGLGGRGRSFAVGVVEEGDEAADEQANLGIARQEGLAEPVAFGGTSPPGWRSGFFFEDAGFEESFEVGPHGGGVDPQDASQFGDLAGPFLERFDDSEAPGVAQEAVAFRSDLGRATPVHRASAQHGVERGSNKDDTQITE